MVSPTTPITASRTRTRAEAGRSGGMIAVAISGAVTTAFLAICALTLAVNAPSGASHAASGVVTTQAAALPDSSP